VEIETFNKFLVGASGRGLTIMNPPRGPMTTDDALLLAAYLVAMADPGGDQFKPVLDAVLNC
jgi:hypothetical protein